jgi:peptide/nickel transport system permease protein
MNSPSQIAWQKFRSNVPALVGLIFIVFCCGVALLAYVLAPDATRHGNLQMLELAKRPPGTRAHVLMIPGVSAAQTTPSNAWGWLLGYEPKEIPLVLQEPLNLSAEAEYLFFQAASGARDSVSLTRLGLTERPVDLANVSSRFVREMYFLLGTDAYGRDLLSRIILGTRISLVIGLMAVLISLVIGVFLGTLAGYFGGWVDRGIMWLVSVVWSIPTLLLALALSLALGKGFWQVFLAIGLSTWVEVARIVRGQIVGIREQAFAEAAHALGFDHARIMFRHVLPNVISPIIVIAVANFGSAVLIESGLSFLGIGVEVPVPTWGRMIYEGYTYIVFENGKWLALFPGMALVGLVVSINLIGIGLRDALDVKL